MPRKTCCVSAKCCGRDNTSRIRRQQDLRKKREEERSAVQSQSEKTNLTLGRQDYEKRVRYSSSCVCRDRGDGMSVQCNGAGPATDLLGVADREQPFYGRAVRRVHAGSLLRA